MGAGVEERLSSPHDLAEGSKCLSCPVHQWDREEAPEVLASSSEWLLEVQEEDLRRGIQIVPRGLWGRRVVGWGRPGGYAGEHLFLLESSRF